MKLARRLSAAWNIIRKGGWKAFDRLAIDSSSGESLDSPYKQSVWVMRAIKLVSGPISAVPLKFSLNEEDYEDPSLTEFWRLPSRGLSLYDFIEASVGWLKLKGETFWVMDDTWLQVGIPQSRLMVIRPDAMTEVVAGDELVGWRYNTTAGVRQLLPNQVVQAKYWNPYNVWRGMAEYDPAEIATQADYLAGKFNLNIMRHNGDTGPYVVSKSGQLDDAQREQITNSLRMKRDMSLRGQFRPVFLSGDLSVEDSKVQAPDANFVANRLASRHEIFIAFGVPPSMADKMESYSVGSASDWYMLIHNTCIPTAEKLAQQITVVARRLTGLPVEAYFDWDEHPVMQAVRTERLKNADALWSKGMPMSKINDYLQLGLPEYKTWNTGYLPFSVAETGSEDAQAPDKSPAFDETQNEEQIEEMKKALDPVQRLRSTLSTQSTQSTTTRARDPHQLAHWRELMAKRRETIKAYQTRFTRELMKARAQVLAKIERAEKTVATRAAAADLMFDLDEFDRGFQAGMRQVGAKALDTAGKQLFAELGKDDPFTMPPAKALEFLRDRENKLSDVGQEIYADIKSEIEVGLDAGETMKQLADRVRSAFNDVSDERAERIAMTETGSAYGYGRQVSMEESGVESKQWLTSGNDNVRDTHQEANGQVVPVNQPFKVGGEDLMHPGDPDGSPENVINCHCVAIATTEKPE